MMPAQNRALCKPAADSGDGQATWLDKRLYSTFKIPRSCLPTWSFCFWYYTIHISANQDDHTQDRVRGIASYEVMYVPVNIS